MKPKIWLYWDNPPGKIEPPPYVQLCWQSIKRHCGDDFDIHMVTSENVRTFLSDIPDYFFQISQINNRSNYLRYALLQAHGGIWLDSDLILFKSLLPLLDLLKDDIDLVATASPTLKPGEPESGFLISTKGGRIMTKAVKLIEYAFKTHPPGHVFRWGSLGPGTVRQAIKVGKYHHLDCRHLMPIPSWEAYRFEGVDDVSQYCDDESYGCMLFHEMFRQANSKFLTMDKEQLLKSNTLLGQMFRKALVANEG